MMLDFANDLLNMTSWMLADGGPAHGTSTGATDVATHPVWSTNVLFFVVNAGVLTLTLGMVMMLYRILRGPQLADRVLAADALSLHMVGIIVLLAIRLQTDVFFDAALIVAIIGFASTLAFAQYIGNRRGTPTS